MSKLQISNCKFQSGEGGIRTHGTVSRTQHFQCCQLSHSCTSPVRTQRAKGQAVLCTWPFALCSSHLLAERVGFEPTVPLRVQRFSRPPGSTALAPLRMLLGFLALQAPRLPQSNTDNFVNDASETPPLPELTSFKKKGL